MAGIWLISNYPAMRPMAYVTALALAAFASLGACSEGIGVVPLDEKRCWPELSEGQRVAGNVRIYMGRYSTVAYSPACDGGALMIEGDTLLGSERAAFERLQAAEDIFSVSFPAYISAEVMRGPRGGLVLRPNVLRRDGPFRLSKLPSDQN